MQLTKRPNFISKNTINVILKSHLFAFELVYWYYSDLCLMVWHYP